ncbi:SET domain-containing protein [Lentinus brumalis]|uniref:SET domain-containing protein n=1 Tax=Lentinus brumalis TaxID=2498619 RepID=A0A371CNQ7_9APHY|nr:SET domain-containing protein [Polyporus brumalis]
MSLDRLLTWISDNELLLHPGVSIVQTDSGIAVFSTEAFNHSQRLATIPKRAVLSVRTCALSEHVHWAPYGHGAVLALSLALYSEILRGAQSRWFGYLQSLPTTIVPIARLWGHPAAFPDETDAREACGWTHGTEVQRELQDNEGASLLTEIDDYYKSDVEPLLMSHAPGPSLSGFLHAYSLVCSRAFLIDAYHGLSMVPIADAFNHSQDNHVQLASEYDVCPVCGSLEECPHDEDAVEGSGSSPPAEDVTDTVDMLAVRSIPAAVEVFNTYGAHLGNAALLARYGFIIDGCDADIVTFGWSGSGLIVGTQDELVEVCQDVKSGLGLLVDTSSSLYHPGDDGRQTFLSINSDGQTSLGLFIWAARDITLKGPPSGLQGLAPSAMQYATAELIIRTFSVLLQVEVRGTMDDDEDADPIADFFHSQALQILVQTAGTISNLCKARLAQMGQLGRRSHCAQRLNELLDTLPPANSKTRCALEYLLGERAILEACAAHWEALRETIGEGSRAELDDGVISD